MKNTQSQNFQQNYDYDSDGARSLRLTKMNDSNINENISIKNNNFLLIGERVRVILDSKELFRQVQEDHGGWSPNMTDV